MIVGLGHLGHALANYGGFASRGFAIRALVDADPAIVGTEIAGLVVAAARPASRQLVAEPSASPSGSSRRRRRSPRRSATGWWQRESAASSTSRRSCSSVPEHVEVRKVDMSIELQILAFHEQRKLAPELTRPTWPGWSANERPGRGPVAPQRTGRPAGDGRAGAGRPAKLLDDVLGSDHAAEALVLSTCNRVEVYADVDKFHGGAEPTSPSCWPATPGSRSTADAAPLRALRGPRGRPPVLRRLRARLDGRRREPDRRAGQSRRCVPRRTPARVGGRWRALVQQSLRVGKRARTETGIDRAGRSLVTAGLDQAALRPRTAGRRRGPGRRRRVDERARRDGRGRPGAARRRGRQPHRSSHASAARRLGRRPRGRGARPARARWPRPTWSSPAPARSGTCRRRAARPVAAPPGRGGRPLVCWTSPCRATSTRPSTTSPASPSSTSRRSPRPSPTPSTRPTSRRPAAIVADEVAAFLGWQRASSVAPTVVALRGMAEDVVAAELAGWRAGCPTSTTRTRDEIESTVRRVVDKLLHAPDRAGEAARRGAGRPVLRRRAVPAVRPRPRRQVEAVTRAEIDEGGARMSDATARSGSAPAAARSRLRRPSWSPTPHRPHRPRGRAGPRDHARRHLAATP